MQPDLTNKEPNKRQNAEPTERGHFLRGIANLSPDYFSLVMATGIVSIAAHLYHFSLFSRALFYLNIVSYVVLCLSFGARMFFYGKEFRSDFFDSSKNMGFLSFIAANCILGSQFVLFLSDSYLGTFFLSIGLLSWVFLMYALFAIHIEKTGKPSLKAISGTWLLIVVATQAISVLSVQLAESHPVFQIEVLFFSFMMFLIGGMFYIILITLIFYRLLFFELRAEELGAPYWISMGADAISALAGATLISIAEKWPFLNDVLPFLKGLTLFFWAIGTWWIPLMVLLGIWRHLVKKIPLTYSPHYWGLVFPLGMYTVATVKLSQVFELPFLMGIPSVFVVVSVATWAIVFIGMLMATQQRYQRK